MSLRSFTLFDLYRRNASCIPERTAVVSEQGALSYSELEGKARSLAGGLTARGVGKGDRVAVLARNNDHFLPLFGAASALGAILVLINRRLSLDEIEHIIGDTDPKLLLLESELRDQADRLMRCSPDMDKHYLMDDLSKSESSMLALEQEPIHEEPVFISGDDPLMIIHTAAMQGKPRGAVLSQHNLILANLQIITALGLDRESCYLNILPLFHIMGINLALAVMQAGGKNVLMPAFDAHQAIQLIRQEEVSLLGTFPPILSNLLEARQEAQEELASLKQVLGLESQETIEKLQSTTPSRFWCMYGQTETSGLITFAPYQEGPGSAGQPGHLTELRIKDDQDRDVPIGQKGEIVVRGPLVFQGYWNAEDLTAVTFREQWHHTGDLGTLDESGFLFFSGRKAEKELIKSGGENVFPVEVEKAILEHPEVAAVSVFGVPDPTFGEGIKAVCVLGRDSSLSKEELIRYVASKIASYKKPRYVEFVASLPLKEDGSVDREAVKAQYGGQ